MSDTGALDEGFGPNIPQAASDVEVALKTGLLSLDANTLLNFYRYSPTARDALLAVLRAAGDRVWVSHQAALEFWRNRCTVIDSRTQATTDLLNAINKNKSALENAVSAWAKQTAIPEDVKAEVSAAFTQAFAQARKIVEDEAEGADTIGYSSEKDSVLSALRELLSNHVGQPLPDDEYKAALKEAERRAKAGEPPGFRDIDKIESGGPQGASGDYLVWIQSIKEAVRRGLPLVIVTGDEKEDWWWRHRSEFMGPRSELAYEFASVSSHALYMLRPVDLTRNASALDVSVSADASEDVERASAKQWARWSRPAVFALLNRLESEKAVQAAVIREAAANGGTIDRERIYDVAGYDEDRMLRGFTRPAARITRALQEEGVLAHGVAPALDPRYETGVIALRFEIPREFVEFLAGEDDELTSPGS